MICSTPETQIYKSLSPALTQICLDLAEEYNDPKVLVFVDNSACRLRVMMDTGIEKPDLVAFLVDADTARRVIRGNTKALSIPSALEIDSLGKSKLKEGEVGDNQGLRYVFSNSRHHPASFLRHALIVNRSNFRLVSMGLDQQYWWPKAEWSDRKWLQKLYSYVNIIRMEAMRPLQESLPALEQVVDTMERAIGIYTATVGGKNFRLLSLFSGRGNGRKPFVALAVSTDDKETRVFKYSWFGKAQFDRERLLLETLKDAPGVVHIDSNLSQACLEENIPYVPEFGMDKEYIRKRSLLVLKTIGFPLCACESVLEFLECMYDLLEVLRYLVQEKNILHRDVSWGNVLIRPIEFGPLVDVKASIAKSQENYESSSKLYIFHTNRFISDIFNENNLKVRVSLADFDHAVDITCENDDDLKNATGTPMFMADDVLAPEVSLAGVFSDIAEGIRQAATLDNLDEKYANHEEKLEWDGFYENFEHLKQKIASRWDKKNEIRTTFRHGAVHDAESVFYLCLLFFNRLWPLDEVVKESDVKALREDRGDFFDVLACRGSNRNTARVFDLPRAGFVQGKKYDPFFVMLQSIRMYLEIAWYNVAATGRGERYEFHLHDYIQRLFLKEIKRLRDSGDPINIEENPLGVTTESQNFGQLYSNSCSLTLLGSEKRRQRGPTAESQARGRARRAGKGRNAKSKTITTKTGSGDGSGDKLVVPVDPPKEMPEKHKQSLPDVFWEIFGGRGVKKKAVASC
ncbi:hypothetical protein ACEPAH_1785 [Sanghuangporus vaninii]